MNPEEFGRELRKIREEKGYTVTQLAKKIGYSQPFVSMLENGKKGIPKPETLKKLAIGLDVPYIVLMTKAGYVDNKKPVLASTIADIIGTDIAPLPDNFKYYLELKMKEKNISLEDLSQKTGVEIEKLNQILNGEIPSPKTLEGLSDGLGDSYLTLLTLTGYLEGGKEFESKDYLDWLEDDIQVESDKISVNKMTIGVLNGKKLVYDYDKILTNNESTIAMFLLNTFIENLTKREKPLTDNDIEFIEKEIKKIFDRV